MIAVTFALPNESSDFVRRLTNGRLHGEEIRVLHTGVGKRAAEKQITNFLREDVPSTLISAGFAGALTNTLQPGDIFLAENFSTQALLARVKSDDWHVGRAETVDAVLDSLGERAALAQKTGAMVVDMETRIIAEACARVQVPMLSLRAISDTAAAPFEIPARVLFDLARQRTPYAALLLHLLKNPNAIGKLFSLARQVALARGALASALDQLIRLISEHE